MIKNHLKFPLQSIVLVGLDGLGVALGAIGFSMIVLGGAFGSESLAQGSQLQQASGQPRRTGKPNDDVGRFLATVLGNVDGEWTDIFRQDGKIYRKPVLVVYQGETNGRCVGGIAQRAMGPFYCPVDQKIYLDTSFFEEIETRYHGCQSKACEFSQAYVIAHEVGHHVQNLLGILAAVGRQQRGMDRANANRLQVRVELQADCLSGLWTKHEGDRLRREGKAPLVEPADIEAALQTAAALGNDRLQMAETGQVVPDSFTHGTSEQRVRWLETGLKEGTVTSCNTFRLANP